MTLVIESEPAPRTKPYEHLKPCGQTDAFPKGLLAAVLDKGPNGTLDRKSGLMTVVIEGGRVRPSDRITVEPPERPFLPLERIANKGSAK